MGWQTGIASVSFLAGLQIQGLLVLNNEHYVFERWHGTLLVIAIASFSVIFNTVAAKQLPMVEGLVLILHVFGFFAILIPLWVLAPRNSASVVFTQFSDNGGWGNIGLALLIGLLSPVFTLLGKIPSGMGVGCGITDDARRGGFGNPHGYDFSVGSRWRVV